MSHSAGRASLQIWAARWRSLLFPTRGIAVRHATRGRAEGLDAWQRRWLPVLAETRGPAAHFADPKYWEVEHTHGSRDSTQEWITAGVEQHIVAKALLGAVASTKRPKPRSAMDDDKESFKILHLGCGSSTLGMELAVLGHEVVEADSSKEAIEKLREQAAQLAAKGAGSERTFEVHDATTLPEEWSNTFDIVVEKGLLDSLLCGGHASAHAAVLEMIRVCKRDGVYVSLSDEGIAPMRMEFLSVDVSEGFRLAHSTLDSFVDKADPKYNDVSAKLKNCHAYMAIGRPPSASGAVGEDVVEKTCGRNEGQQRIAMFFHAMLVASSAGAYFTYLRWNVNQANGVPQSE